MALVHFFERLICQDFACLRADSCILEVLRSLKLMGCCILSPRIWKWATSKRYSCVNWHVVLPCRTTKSLSSRLECAYKLSLMAIIRGSDTCSWPLSWYRGRPFYSAPILVSFLLELPWLIEFDAWLLEVKAAKVDFCGLIFWINSSLCLIINCWFLNLKHF